VHDLTIESRPFAGLDSATLYAVLRLRVDVFVVEQRCPYPELDGRDIEASALHVVARGDGNVVGYLRLLTEPDGRRRIGRVCVASVYRRNGVAGRLVTEALRHCDGDEVMLDSQSHLQGWYARHGFEVAGPEFVEDGIPHVPMRRRSGERLEPA